MYLNVLKAIKHLKDKSDVGIIDNKMQDNTARNGAQ